MKWIIDLLVVILESIGYIFIHIIEKILRKISIKGIIKYIKVDFINFCFEVNKDFRDVINIVSGVSKKLLLKRKKPRVPNKYKKKKSSIQQEKPEKPNKKKKFHFISFIFGILFSTFFIFIPLQTYIWFRELPNPESLISESIGNKSTKILDRNGRLLYEIFVDKKFAPVKLNQIPEHLIQATIAVEDDQFYTHKGIRIDSIIRAAKSNLIDDDFQGGSTITQQLIKNVLLTSERTLSRKLKEAALALVVETKYTKEQILEMYMNNIPYGGTSWGIQAASQKFFGKNAWELDLAESSLLAGLPSSPTRYSPLSDFETAKVRQKYVLNRMVLQKFLTPEEADIAYAEELSFTPQFDYIQAPHFVDYVRKELERIYGRRMIDYGGLTVTTTIDLDLQQKVQDAVTKGIQNNLKLNINNGAAVVIDPKTSQILSYVGSVDYFKERWGAYDVASAYRQPGSSIKPVTYALALSKDYTPASILKDQPVTFKIEGQQPYKPVNYDGKYHGEVTIRQALANSYNIPAVVLSNDLGPDNIVLLGRDMGLRNWAVDGSYGLSVTLGGKEVKLIDLTNVYATFARGGYYSDLDPFISIKDGKGYEIYWKGQISSQPVTGEVSYIIWHILSDNGARTPAFGSNSSLVIPNYTVAVKTGTTDSKRDNWTIGFTPSYAVGVWVGNNDNTPMNPALASGLSGAAPIWNEIMKTVLQDKPDEKMPVPENIFIKVDEKCKPEVSEIFIKGSKVPRDLCKTSSTPKNSDD